MREVAVIADDLTGAADCGIAFASAGLATFVAFGEGEAPPGAQVIAVDTDSRMLPAARAAERTHAAALRACREGARVLYKKLDSTLRGQVGAELAAVLRAVADAGRGRALAVLAPAFPATGRTTVDGRVLVKGVPLDETEVWRDSGTSGPADPGPMLAAAGLRTAVVPLARVRAGDDALAAAFEAAREADAVVCDALADADLAAIARAGARLARPVVWAGSGGLARHLSPALGLRGDASRAPARAPRRAGGAVLALVGSRSSVAREQARRLAAEPDVVRVELDPRALLGGGAAAADVGAALGDALASGRDVVATVGEEPVGAGRGVELAAAAGRAVAPHVAGLRGAVATGGDMARGLLSALGATGLHLLGEVEPGVPLGIVDATPPLTLATKAGAFGSPDTLVRCRAFLRGAADERARGA